MMLTYSRSAPTRLGEIIGDVITAGVVLMIAYAVLSKVL
jgi:hypothetical protein